MGQLDFLLQIFERYGVELVGSVLLAITISLFYRRSTIKEGLLSLSCAFWTIAVKDIVLIVLSLLVLHSPQLVLSEPVYIWINLIFICIASAFFFTSTLQASRLLFTGTYFAVACTFLLAGGALAVQFSDKISGLLIYLPNIYISATFLIVGLSLIMLKTNRHIHALRAVGFGFILLGFYYLQTILGFGVQSWIYQSAIYIVVLILSLITQISILDVYSQTLEHNLTAEKARRDLILDSSPFPVLLTRLVDDSIIHINPVAQKLFDIEDNEINNFKFSNYFVDPAKRLELLARIKRETVIHSFEVQLKKPSTNQAFWLDLSTRIIDLDGELALYTTFKDTTAKKQKEEALFTQASTDPLTGLFNRRQFETMVKTQLDLATRHGTSFCMVMIDIDHFKKVNDTYGHDAGDEVLKHIALVLKSSLRISDILARFGGEEFVIFLPHTTPTEAWRVAERIRMGVENAQIKAGEHTISVTISLGLSSTQHASINAQIKEADTALYASKTTGRNKSTLYVPDMKESKKERSIPIDDLRPDKVSDPEDNVPANVPVRADEKAIIPDTEDTSTPAMKVDTLSPDEDEGALGSDKTEPDIKAPVRGENHGEHISDKAAHPELSDMKNEANTSSKDA